jgi:type I restriction enzyme R subunit
MKVYQEQPFEDLIEAALVAHGWQKLPRDGYDKARALFPDVVLGFLRETQAKKWEKLEKLHGANTGEIVLADLCRMLDKLGCLTVIRHGFKCYGQLLRVAFYRPAHGLNPEAEQLYAANRLGVTRQLQYSERNANELDLTLSLNGIPVATAELKNPMTGSTVEHAEKQYREDRDQRETIFDFKRRTLVHFCVDTERVTMTTKLAGGATTFLPFNKGFNGGAGNPPDMAGMKHRTAYLWEEVWARDSWLDILGRFIHLQTEERRTDEGQTIKREVMVFPRYHQLDAVRALVGAARKEGPGHNYLVEHSAGSGKSNTIAWLGHRLASLHDAEDRKVFDSVVVISDRRVLDQQLQDTIYQFDHKQGVVQKIDQDSRQLAEALRSGVPVVITTLQKFPFVTDQLKKIGEEEGKPVDGVLPKRRYAVIVDEAHSSQSGEGAADMKEVLGGESLREKVAKEAKADNLKDYETEVLRAIARRGHQEHISFFAFTATPKHKTFGVFGRNGEPFHRYTMRQAIEEGFIMDVLKYYTTYKTYYRLLKSCEDDPHVVRKKAAKALARFMRLHPHNLAQKTEVMLEHFRTQTRHKIGGRAKAMVITGSRLEAVRYKQSFDRYIAEKGYKGIKTLVAFSGMVQDDRIPGKTYTEPQMNNGIRELELPEKFATAEYQVLLVAEKYQTGFDQPLLHTMYVDKRLAGIQAVQSLSRLNRMHPLKEDTFILDFVNDREEIFQAFKDYYEGAEFGAEPEPAKLYEVQAELDSSGLYTREEVEAFCRVFFLAKRRSSASDHERMEAALEPATERFRAMKKETDEEAEELRAKIQVFRSLYSYLAQIVPFQDTDLEKLYTFLRFLSAKLPKRGTGPAYEFDDEVRLEYYRLQKISEGSIGLNQGQAQALKGPLDVGTHVVRETPIELSRLIDILNDRFGTDFTDSDQLYFDQIREAAVESMDLRQAAEANPLEKFQILFRNIMQSLVIDRMEQNEELTAKVLNDETFQKVVAGWLGEEVYRRLREGAPADYAAK